MRKTPKTNKLRYVGAALLEGESVTLIQAARLVLEIKEALGDEICTINRCREVVSLGLNAIKNKHHTVSFGTAAVECLRSKSHRRPRTLTDIRSIIQKLKKSNPELEQTPLRNISVEDCQSILMNTFTTSRQRHKARLILSGIFSFSVKRGWCDENPILRVDTPFLKEQEIPALTLKEVTLLLKTCMDEFNGTCVAGAALMIFAGIRPQEVERLLWENIAIRDGCVILNSKHTKTGGARHVTILPCWPNGSNSAATGQSRARSRPSARRDGRSNGAKSGEERDGAAEKDHGCRTACGIPTPAITPSISRTTTCCKWKWGTAPPPCSAPGT